jgi:hypothetical protein
VHVLVIHAKLAPVPGASAGGADQKAVALVHGSDGTQFKRIGLHVFLAKIKSGFSRIFPLGRLVKSSPDPHIQSSWISSLRILLGIAGNIASKRRFSSLGLGYYADEGLAK